MSGVKETTLLQANHLRIGAGAILNTDPYNKAAAKELINFPVYLLTICNTSYLNA